MDRSVPLVIYQDGVREVIGRAIVEDNGDIAVEISPEGLKLLNLVEDLHDGTYSIVDL